MSFQPGDIVILKSGGPRMTVASVSGDQISCHWFARTKTQNGTFNASMLAKPSRGGAIRFAL